MQTDLPAPLRDPYFLTYPQIDQVYRELDRLKESFGLNPPRRYRAEIMIGACILHKFNTQRLIVKALGSRGLSRNFVIRLLHERTGELPGEHLWRYDDDGRYHLLDLA